MGVVAVVEVVGVVDLAEVVGEHWRGGGWWSATVAPKVASGNSTVLSCDAQMHCCREVRAHSHILGQPGAAISSAAIDPPLQC